MNNYSTAFIKKNNHLQEMKPNTINTLITHLYIIEIIIRQKPELQSKMNQKNILTMCNMLMLPENTHKNTGKNSYDKLIYEYLHGAKKVFSTIAYLKTMLNNNTTSFLI